MASIWKVTVKRAQQQLELSLRVISIYPLTMFNCHRKIWIYDYTRFSQKGQ